MAVTLVLEDGTGIASANAYLNATEADAILELNPTAYAIWSALDAADMDAYLVWASKWIDNYVTWKGYKAVATSGLRWPRCGVYDRDGIIIAETVIPQQLKEAVAQIAVWLVNNEVAGTGGQSSNLPEGIQRVKADVVEIEFFDGAASDSQSGSDLMPINIKWLIKGLGYVDTGRQRIAKAVR